MNTKIKWLREKIKMQNMKAIIISNPYNIKYLTGIEAEGTLIIARKENFFLTDGRYLETAKSVLTIDDEIVVTDISKMSREDYETFFIFCENVGFEENYITYAQYKDYMQKYKVHNFEETDYIIEKQRMIKDEEEIAKITKACEITDRCFEHIIEYIKIGKTEKEIACEIERFFIESGADELAFETIVASGRNSSKPHAKTTDKKIEMGDPITIDMGCKVDGYCSDMTRTIFVGQVPEYVKPVYELVLKNQKQITNEMKEGVNLKLLSRMVESDFKLRGYDLIHALGHGVGLEVHELPYASTRIDFNLKNNMVLTNEPGIYIPNKFGVRIEDTIVIDRAVAISLTKSDRDYVIVDKK